MKNKFIKRTIAALATFSMCVPFFQAPVATKAATSATISLSSTKQLIRGFGGINHVSWAGDLTATQRETAFGNGTNQLGFSVLRIYVDGDKNNWYKEVATAKNAIQHGALVFASPWNPPSDMTETFTRNGVTGQKRLRYDKYAAYAQHLNDFVTYMKNNGVNLYAISVQNEPDYAHTWTWWTPQEVLRFMKENAGTINCKVMAPESFSYLKNISDPILNDPQALANMDILGTHTYGTSVSNFAYPLFKQKGAGKELWMTEVYVPNSDANSADRWPEALDVASHMNNAMVVGDFQAYVWWYIRRSYGPMKEDGNISKRGYMMAHFSKFVRPGYVRVDATANPTTNVEVSAYKKDNSKVVIIAINKGTTNVTQNFSMQNSSAYTVSSWVTTGSKNLAPSAAINAINGSFIATLPAQSVTTFVADLNGSTTTPIVTKVGAPTFSVAAGTYSTAQTVSLSSAATGSTIYYTTDGSTPTTSSAVYSSAITVSKTTTIKAIAVKSGMTNSDVASATYTISTSTTTTPTASGIEVTYAVANDWGSGASVNVTIKNNGTTSINGWNLVMALPSGQSVSSLWNASYTTSGSTVTVTNSAYNGSIAANGGTQTFGFNLNYSGTFSKPSSIKLNGIACTIK